ncbi:MerR family transcriptional regulator [Pediococcus pentosaceus]|uniref:MerR family transcriptional regulator n=1 Tax=Pediococcus pentosaceus TaxID=1255 RepID=UPI000B4AF9A1|nr:MerR family transcriptional regulator [Pediococcus pentosaceus]ASC08642.1 HTH-type transcriptional regulator [Pediococcus pentosaceus]WFC01257.1 MerR family transcriptional regulator [Pediococcus pentosaceus]
MSEKELRRSMAVLPIGTVMKLTSLTARQIRYYEENELVFPDRSEGNRRLFSLNDIDRLLEIKDFIAEGLNIADIKQRFEQRKEELKRSISDTQMRKILREELLQTGRLSDDSGPVFPIKRA